MIRRRATHPAPPGTAVSSARSAGRGLAAGLAAAAVLAMALASPAPALAAGVAFDEPAADAVLLQPIQFRQTFRDATQPRRVELVLDGANPWSSDVVEADVSPSADGYQAVVTLADHVLPNTTFRYRFRVVQPDGNAELGPPGTVTVEDRRFAWRTVSGPTLRLHWYKGDEAFARRALDLGEAAIARAAKLLGVTDVPTSDFFVYGDTQAFLQALGPGTRENTGGEFVPEIRTMFAEILPDEIGSDWVGIVIPHELTHLVFELATANPYHAPPLWLNEGLAVYLSEGGPGPRSAELQSAIRSGSVIPLDGLDEVFPRTQDGFHLAYAEAVSAVDSFIRTHGQKALVSLIRSYASGMDDDSAFRAAAGVTLAGFESAWLKSIGVPDVKALGPQPAPPGPLPGDWTRASVVNQARPAASSHPAPAPSGSRLAGSTPASDDNLAVRVALLLGLITVTIGGAMITSSAMERRNGGRGEGAA